MMGWLDSRTWCWAPLLKHPLFVAVVQLLVGGLIAYVFTERWQRWRQRREFQHRTLAKFSELSYEMMDLLAELLMLRGKVASDIYAQKRRELLTRWTVLMSIRGEMMAAYGWRFISTADYQGIFKALRTLRSYVAASDPVPRDRFEPEQEKFLAYREAVVAHMVRAMGLLSGREWKTELGNARARVQAAEAAAATSGATAPLS